MLTDQDLQKIGQLIEVKTKPQFDEISRRFTKVDKSLTKIDTRLNRMDKDFHKRLNTLEARTKKYTLDAAETVVKGVD